MEEAHAVSAAEARYQLDGFRWARTCVELGAISAISIRHDYFDGDIESLSGDRRLDLVTRMGISSPYQVSLHASRRRYAFWRSWQHISGNKENIVVMRYVKSGSFSLTQCGTTVTVGPGQFSFSKSSVPFRWESLLDNMGLSEYYSILLPLDVAHRYFPHGVPLKDSVSVSSEEPRLAMPALLSLLTEQGRHLEPAVVAMLLDTLLQEAVDVSKKLRVSGDARKHIGERRTDDIVAYISMHLSNPDICAVSVASACGISLRYLCHLLKIKGTTFSDLLWEERLKKAKDWLLALDAKHHTISEIAYMNGFKTAAHFSRLFKSRWGCSPRQYRTSGVVGVPA
jgi:AraC-like DNA-binding protein